MEISTLCRACLAENATISLFSSENSHLTALLSDCAAFKMEPEEGLPDSVCTGCEEVLVKFSIFRDRCRETDIILRESLMKERPNGDHDYSIDVHEVIADNVSISSSLYQPQGRQPKKHTPKGLAKKSKKKQPKRKLRTEKLLNKISVDKNIEFSKTVDYSTVQIKRTRANRKKRSSEKYICNECGYKATDGYGLSVHLRRHTGERPYACPHCPKAFAVLTNLKAHSRVHSGERPFICESCGRGMCTAAALAGHARTHSGERPFLCGLCGRGFALKSNLRAHVRIHTGERPHQCKLCEKRFTTSSDARAHERTHSGARPHLCALCPRAFALRSNLRAHTRAHARGALDTNVPCAHCDAVFSSRSALATHQRAHASTTILKSKHTCSHCGKTYARRSGLLVHKRKNKTCADADVLKKEQPLPTNHDKAPSISTDNTPEFKNSLTNNIRDSEEAANQKIAMMDSRIASANQNAPAVGLTNRNLVLPCNQIICGSKLPEMMQPAGVIAVSQLGQLQTTLVPLTMISLLR